MERFNNEYGHHQDKDIVRQICNSGFRAIGSRRRFRVGNDRFQVYSIRRRARRAQRVNVPIPQGNDARRERRERRAQVVNPVPQFIEQPFIEQPFIEQPIDEQLFIEQPIDEQLFIEQPIDEQPFIEQPIDEQPYDKSPIPKPIQETEDEQPYDKSPIPKPIQETEDEQPYDKSPIQEAEDKQPIPKPIQETEDEPPDKVPDTRSKRARKKEDPDYKGPKAKKIKTTGGDSSASDDPKDDSEAEEVPDVRDIPSESDQVTGNIGIGESSGSLTKPEARREMDSEDVSLQRLQAHLCNMFKESATVTGMFKGLVASLPSEESPMTLSQLDQKVRDFMLELHFNKDDIAQLPPLDQGAIDSFNALPGMNEAFSFDDITCIYLTTVDELDIDNSFKALRAKLLEDDEIGIISPKPSTTTKLSDPFIKYLSPDEKNRYDVYKSELECLKPGKELKSSILNFYMWYLQQQPGTEECLFLHSYFYAALLKYVTEENVDLKAMGRRQPSDFFKKRFVFIPVHGGFHWSLVIVWIVDCPKKILLLHFDSLGSHSSDTILNNLERYLQAVWESGKDVGETEGISFSRKAVTPPQQENFIDCGFFVLFYSEQFLKDLPKVESDLSRFGDKWFEPAEASNLRSRILKMLEEKFD